MPQADAAPGGRKAPAVARQYLSVVPAITESIRAWMKELKSKYHGRFSNEVRAAYRAVHQAVATACKEPLRSRVLCTKRALRGTARLFEMPPQTHEQARDRFALAHAAFKHFVEQGEMRKTSSPMSGPFIVSAGCRSTARARSSAAASDCAMRWMHCGQCRLEQLLSDSLPEMRIQEVVDTINKLRGEPTPDYKSVDGQARKDGLDFSICPTS